MHAATARDLRLERSAAVHAQRKYSAVALPCFSSRGRPVQRHCSHRTGSKCDEEVRTGRQLANTAGKRGPRGAHLRATIPTRLKRTSAPTATGLWHGLPCGGGWWALASCSQASPATGCDREE
eukprot:scaffold142650_cov32-Tisochrysis_lutea.AAC.6